MKFLKEFISYLPIIAIKGFVLCAILFFILELIGIDLLKGTSLYTHMHYYIIAVLAVGSIIHFFFLRDK